MRKHCCTPAGCGRQMDGHRLSQKVTGKGTANTTRIGGTAAVVEHRRQQTFLVIRQRLK